MACTSPIALRSASTLRSFGADKRPLDSSIPRRLSRPCLLPINRPVSKVLGQKHLKLASKTSALPAGVGWPFDIFPLNLFAKGVRQFTTFAPQRLGREASLIEEIASLDWNPSNESLAQSYGLAIQTISWEDTARTKDSCWGPNIADLTLNVADLCLPMIRKPNFADVTADVPMTLFSVTTGNETAAGELKRVSLRDYVAQTLGLPNLILERDDVLLASAQACVLPCDVSGQTEFCPQLFSYQSRADDPAVLIIVASAQGTSAHVITEENQALLFNRGGRAAMFLAKRLSQDRRERGVSEAGAMTADELDRNAILLFQIPLKQRQYEAERIQFTSVDYGEKLPVVCDGSAGPYGRLDLGSDRPLKGLEYATLRASDKTYGDFRGVAGFKLERDARFPIRVTFQMYTVTDDPVLKKAQVKDLANRIEKVYASGKETGSLVTNTTARATEARPLESVAGAHHMPLFRSEP